MKPIDDALIARTAEAAQASPRRRMNHDYHAAHEVVQRMLNALRDDSYVRPHRHADPDKVEVFLALQGRFLVLTFDEAGGVADHHVIGPEGPVRGVEIPPRTWHALLALDPVAVAYEVIQGPYDPATHKAFAPWAPEDAEEGLVWIRAIRDRVLGQAPRAVTP
jgi:cupin fold WbuC family metalloprotein